MVTRPTLHPPEGFRFVDGSVLGELAWQDCADCKGTGMVWKRSEGRADLVRCEGCCDEVRRRGRMLGASNSRVTPGDEARPSNA